jgi:hypothetical protein
MFMADTTSASMPMPEFQTVTTTGQPVSYRIATPAAAYAIFKTLDLEEGSEAQRRAILRGMIDGNPPYDDKELQESGLGFMVNVNFMTLRSNLDARAAAAHELFMEVPTLVELRVLAAKDSREAQARQHDANVLAEEFSQLLEDWPEFLSTMDLVFRESDAYGIGFGLWPDEWDWRMEAFERGALLFDARARVDVNKNELYMIRGELDAAFLIRVAQSPEIAREEGWHVGPVRDLLVRTFITEGETSKDNRLALSTWESLQAQIRNNDLTYQAKQFARVKVVHILSREVSGDQRISHLIIPEPGGAGSEVFLYEGRNRFERMDQVLWWLPMNYGTGRARSVRGVASLMAPHDDLSTRFLCRVFDAAQTSASLLLQPNGATDLARLNLIRHGPYTILPPGLKAVQATFQPQLTPLVQLRAVSEAVMRNNTGTYRPHAETMDQLTTPRTAREVVEEKSQELRYEKAAIAHRYVLLERFYRETRRRAMRVVFEAPEGRKFPGQAEAKAFVARCERRGVERKVLKAWQEHFRVYATRAVGLGSLSFGYDITDQVLRARMLYDEVGQVNATRDWLAKRVGQRNVDRYRAPVDRDQVPSAEHSHAALENNDLREGSPVVVGTDQLHVIHILSHISEVIQPVVLAVQQGAVQDPERALAVLQVAVGHVEQHLGPVAGDPERKDFVKSIEEVLQGARKAEQELARAAEQLQQQRAQEQAEQEETLASAERVLQDRDLEARVLEIQNKYRLGLLAQESLNQMRTDKTREQLDIRRQQASEDMRLRADKQAVEIELMRERADQEAAARERRPAGGGEGASNAQ